MFQEQGIAIQIHCGQMQELGPALHHFQRAIKVIPLVAGLALYCWPRPFGDPYLAGFGVEPEPGFVHHPHAHPAANPYLESLEPRPQLIFESLCRYGICSGVSGPRQLSLPCVGCPTGGVPCESRFPTMARSRMRMSVFPFLWSAFVMTCARIPDFI